MIDRITALVIKDSLEAISEEMSKTVDHTYSPSFPPGSGSA